MSNLTGSNSQFHSNLNYILLANSAEPDKMLLVLYHSPMSHKKKIIGSYKDIF